MRARREGAGTVLAAIRLYKRGFCTSGSRVWIESRDPLRTPIADAVEFYSGVFSQPRAEWQPENLKGEHFRAVGDLEISRLFTAEQVQESIDRYPSDKSCGEDSAHVRILEALGGSKFSLYLFLLFWLCCLTGLTPE